MEKNEKGLGNDQGKKEEENQKVFDKGIDKETKDKNELTEDTDTLKPKSDKVIEKENEEKEDDKSKEDTDAVIENTVKGIDKEIEEKEDENQITQETDGDHKTELNSENTSRTVTDATEVGEVAQIQSEDQNCEEKQIEADAEGGAVEIKTLLPDDKTDDDMKEQIVGTGINRDEEEEMQQDDKEEEMEQDDEEEGEDLEKLMQEENGEHEEISNKSDETDGEAAASSRSSRSSRSFTSEYGRDGDDDNYDDGQSLKSFSYKSSADAGTSGYDSERYLPSYVEQLYM